MTDKTEMSDARALATHLALLDRLHSRAVMENNHNQCDLIREARAFFASLLSRQPIGLVEGLAAAFDEWLSREIPPGTVISDPHWWAPRILRQIETIYAAQDHVAGGGKDDEKGAAFERLMADLDAREIEGDIAKQPARGGEVDRLRSLLLSAAMHVRPTCPDLYDEINAALAQKPADKEVENLYPGVYVYTSNIAGNITRQNFFDMLDVQRRTEQPADEGRRPDGYAYRYPATLGNGTVIRHNSGVPVNGSSPIESIPYYYHTPPRADAAMDDAMVERTALALYLRDGGSELIWASVPMSLPLRAAYCEEAMAALTAALKLENSNDE